jgi:hypothetical protein
MAINWPASSIACINQNCLQLLTLGLLQKPMPPLLPVPLVRVEVPLPDPRAYLHPHTLQPKHLLLRTTPDTKCLRLGG